jgi:hypothetical protein
MKVSTEVLTVMGGSCYYCGLFVSLKGRTKDMVRCARQ